jgi:hypothetical protein
MLDPDLRKKIVALHLLVTQMTSIGIRLRLLFDDQHLNIGGLGTAAAFGQVSRVVDIATARAKFAF